MSLSQSLSFFSSFEFVIFLYNLPCTLCFCLIYVYRILTKCKNLEHGYGCIINKIVVNVQYNRLIHKKTNKQYNRIELKDNLINYSKNNNCYPPLINNTTLNKPLQSYLDCNSARNNDILALRVRKNPTWVR